MSKDEVMDLVNKKKRVLDQMASMHFKLSDEYKRWATIEDVIEIVISVVLCGITFLDCEKYFGIPSNISGLVVGFISIFLLAFTLVKQGLGHKQLCEKHQLAGKMYTKAKLDLVNKIADWLTSSHNENEVLTYLNEHYSALNDLPQIPEKHFARLKHAHQAKIAFSKFLDDHQHEFWMICKIKYRLGIDLARKSKTERDNKEVCDRQQ